MGVLHGIVDGVVDNYVLIDGEVSADLDDIETAVFSGADMDSSTIYRLKREVLEFRRATVPWPTGLDEDELLHVMLSVLQLPNVGYLQVVIDDVESTNCCDRRAGGPGRESR